MFTPQNRQKILACLWNGMGAESSTPLEDLKDTVSQRSEPREHRSSCWGWRSNHGPQQGGRCLEGMSVMLVDGGDRWLSLCHSYLKN